MNRIKKIWNVIAWPLWMTFIISLCLFSAYCSWKHSQHDKQLEIKESRVEMEIGSALMLNICQRDSINTRQQADSVFAVESEIVLKRIYNDYKTTN